MSEHQLSFLSASSLDACDLNAVDHGVVVHQPAPATVLASVDLSERIVDDWVFGLGFTNWKAVIDHALQTGHYEIHASGEDDRYGLRKHGYRYAPIPRLPRSGVTYIQQQLLNLASERLKQKKPAAIRHTPVTAGLAYRCLVSNGVFQVEVSGPSLQISFTLPVAHLEFSDHDPRCSSALTNQVASLLGSEGLSDHAAQCAVARMISAHLMRLVSTYK